MSNQNKLAVALGLTLLMLFSLTVPAAPATGDEDDHSKNLTQLALRPIEIAKDVVARGSDLAFHGNRVYAGTYEGTAVFEITSAEDGYLRQIGFHNCPGSQGDVSVVGDYVFVSVDSPSSNKLETPFCNNTRSNVSETSTETEGVRIVDFSNLREPRQVGFVEVPCGSHTHTLVPDGEFTYMYIQSYPLSQSASCNAVVGHGQVGIVRFPTSNPGAFKVMDPFDVTPTPIPQDVPIGCHDLQAWPARDIAIAACITESQVWDIKDPAKPKVLARIYNPQIQVHHSAAFTWDGKYAIVSDEYGGAAGGGGCTGDADGTVGAMWFYDITEPSSPRLAGHYSLPRVPEPDTPEEAERWRCTTHIYAILPMRDADRYIAVASFYQGGISVVDFSDPANPKEIGHYLASPEGVNPDTWSAYWYNGRVYTNDHLSKHGVGVYEVAGLDHERVHYYVGGLNPQTQVARFR